LRVVLGPQHEAFDDDTIKLFLASPYTVTPDSDRMGIRLQGEALPTAQTDAGGSSRGAMVSDGIVTGCIQVPPDGQPIVMMVDHQTTGGYPKIATVVSADIPLLAQSLPGDVVRFAPTTTGASAP
jgi:allophanate hydrolase subunit 2